MKLYAHRGSHRAAIENTLEAFSIAISEGAEGVELDVRATRDGAVVVFHDADLTRLAGDPRKVAEVDRAELPEVGGAPIPTLDEVLDLVLGAGLEVNVEIKAAAAETAALLASRSPKEIPRVFVSSFLTDALETVRGALPSVRLAYLFERLDPVMSLTWDGLHPYHELCTPERVRAWKDAGLFINVWTLNDPSAVPSMMDMGIDGLVTDDVPALRAACRSLP